MTDVLFASSERNGFTTSGTVDEITTAGRFTSGPARCAIRIQGTASYAETKTWSAANTFWFHGKLYNANAASGQNHAVFYNGTTAVFRLRAPSTSTIQMEYWNGSAWTTIGAAASFPAGTLDVIDIKVVSNTVSGSAELYVGGALLASGTADLSGIAGITKARLQATTATNGNNWSEVICANASTVDWVSELEAPTADGSDAGGTGTFADVDEAVTNDADFLSLASAGDKHSFTSPARTNTSGAVKGVTVSARAKCDASGPQSMKFYLIIGGTRYYSPNIALSTGFDGYSYTWSQNPATSSDWVSADAEAATLNWGVEAVA